MTTSTHQTPAVSIESIGYELAPHRISSTSLEAGMMATMERLGLPQGQLEGLTGIRERRFWDEGTTPSEVATLAARRALQLAGIGPADVGCLISTSVCKDYVEPSVACIVHGNLGLSPHCLNFDLGNACLGFLNAIDVVAMMLRTGAIRYGLIVDGESSREPVEATVRRLSSEHTTLDDIRRNFATLTIGSGAVAMVLARHADTRSGHLINGSVALAATEHNQMCVGQRDYMHVDPTALMMAGVKLAKQTWALAAAELSAWDDSLIDLYAPHQVSVRNQEALNNALGINAAKVFLNVQTLGNIGPAALPITLAMAAENGHLQSGHHTALMGIGSGLNCVMMSVTW